MSMTLASWPPSVPSLERSLRATILQRLDPSAAEPLDWQTFLSRHFAAYTTAPNAPRHDRFWAWVSGLRPGERPPPRVEVWPRGGAKSTTVELGCAYLGAQPSPARHFVLYVSETQAQANTHVQAIAAMLEVAGVGRAVNQYGASKGWTQTRVRTSTGFNVSAFGLDAGMRGIKLDQYRPDVIVFDDIDGRHDTPDTTRKKVETITTSILPAESADCAIIVVQNKITEDSIVSQLCDGRADFLHDRLPATVEQAVDGLDYTRVIEDGRPRYRITAGTATWAGQDIATCERQMNAWGLDAFLREAQHEVDKHANGLWKMERDIDPWRVILAPPMHRIVVGVDPSGSATGDAVGIVVAGVSKHWNGHLTGTDHFYVLHDGTIQGSPKEWAEQAVRVYSLFDADAMIAERNYGGDMVKATIESVPGAPSVKLVTATRGKIVRAEPVQKAYEDGTGHHVGVFPKLEKEMTSYVQGDGDSPNRMDALVWAITDLQGVSGGVSDSSAFARAPESPDAIARRRRSLTR